MRTIQCIILCYCHIQCSGLVVIDFGTNASTESNQHHIKISQDLVFALYAKIFLARTCMFQPRFTKKQSKAQICITRMSGLAGAQAPVSTV